MAQRKETKTIQVRDLKPKKDAKGGASINQTRKGQNQNHSQNQSQSRNMTVAGG